MHRHAVAHRIQDTSDRAEIVNVWNLSIVGSFVWCFSRQKKTPDVAFVPKTHHEPRNSLRERLRSICIGAQCFDEKSSRLTKISRKKENVKKTKYYTKFSPLASAVEPLVYCRNAMPCVSIGGNETAEYSDCFNCNPSVTCQGKLGHWTEPRRNNCWKANFFQKNHIVTFFVWEFLHRIPVEVWTIDECDCTHCCTKLHVPNRPMQLHSCDWRRAPNDWDPVAALVPQWFQLEYNLKTNKRRKEWRKERKHRINKCMQNNVQRGKRKKTHIPASAETSEIWKFYVYIIVQADSVGKNIFVARIITKPLPASEIAYSSEGEYTSNTRSPRVKFAPFDESKNDATAS